MAIRNSTFTLFSAVFANNGKKTSRLPTCLSGKMIWQLPLLALEEKVTQQPVSAPEIPETKSERQKTE